MTRIFIFVFSFLSSVLVHAQNGFYPSVLKITSFDGSPDYFYINTNIPANDSPAPQLHITGYNYAHPTNKAVDITLGWYHYIGSFYWTQYHSTRDIPNRPGFVSAST
ncbi:hypothetical protein [Niabella hibiscisoli]|uniref:hypothetical protein n=1 Tax=Niabella hibiscisoli TaxID=1825928 RepID=UPI001F0D5F25|nr:hypothetical protein [Niabella hibiscisoli]MCH5718228.1 hypothetical protein [Niabella hibiscisoli]